MSVYRKSDYSFTSPMKNSNFHDLSEKRIQDFIGRMKSIRSEASTLYRKILKNEDIVWKNPGHVRAVVAICRAFQDYSFVRSAKTDLYQLVFYNFAKSFKRDAAAQFLTPLEVIDFIVKIVNPRNGDTVFDPCCGIGDFLSVAFVNAANKKPSLRLDDANIYGVDLDDNMITLATLNMLLNGDGEAKLFNKPDKGSILAKIAEGNPPRLVDLNPSDHVHGAWDNWKDETELKKFDVVLTNPPFGEDRAYRAKTQNDRAIIGMYETWHLTRPASTGETKKGKSGAVARAKGSDALDQGIVFLENAFHSLRDEGRLGIVLSNSIASEPLANRLTNSVG